MGRSKFRLHAERFATTRMTLVVIGVVSGFLAYSTYHSYTSKQLPTRDVCVMLLIAMCVIGIGTSIVRPNPVTRSMMGVCLMLHSALRGYGLIELARNRSNGFTDMLGNMNAVYIHIIVFYLGYLLWARSRQSVNDEATIRQSILDEMNARGGGGDQ